MLCLKKVLIGPVHLCMAMKHYIKCKNASNSNYLHFKILSIKVKKRIF